MDIDILIDECGRVTFSACPEEILRIALSLSPDDPMLQTRAALLPETPPEGMDDHGQARGSDEC